MRQIAGHKHTAAAPADTASSSGGSSSGGSSENVWRVETIGAQLRDGADLERRICAACGTTRGGEPLTRAAAARADHSEATSSSSGSSSHGAGLLVPPANALLFVSGSHPVRQVPGVDRWVEAVGVCNGVCKLNPCCRRYSTPPPLASPQPHRPTAHPSLNRFLPGSVSLLRAASALRGAGAIPAATSLWAVANPVTERNAARLEAKIEAGAQAVLTQPPLDWPAFEAWWADVERRGLQRAARILIGFPALSSAANASFWVALAGAAGSAGARDVVRRFAEAEARGKGAAAAFAKEYSEEQLARVRGVGRVGRSLHTL